MHRYLVYTGIGQVTVFLPLKNVPEGMGTLIVGQPILCSVTNYNTENKFLTVTVCDPSIGSDTTSLITEAVRTSSSKANKKLSKELITTVGITGLSFQSLLPGVLVQVTVQKVLDNGLLVKFLDAFYGVIDSSSLGVLESKTDWQTHIAEGDLIYARITFVDHPNKTVRLSYRSHFLDMKIPSPLPQLGELIYNLKVFQVMRKTGVYLIPNEPGVGVFIHTSNLSSIVSDTITDEELESLKDDDGVNEGNIHSLYSTAVISRARVLGYHLVEGIIIASNRIKHLKNNSVTHWSDIKLGEVYQGTITSVEDIGLKLVIKDKIHAFCPAIHTSDVVNLSSIKFQTKFKIGNKIKIRVWQVKKNGSIIVTHKKSFVDEDKGNIFSFKDMSVGKIGLGLLTRVHSDEGLRIHFYSGMRGFIPKQILLKQGITDIADSYRVGQVLKCVFLGKYKSKDIVYKVSKGDEGAREIIFLALNLDDPKEILITLHDEMKRLIGDAVNLLLLSNQHHHSNNNNDEEEDDLENNIDCDDDDGDDDINNDNSTTPRLVSGVLSKVEENALRIVLDNGRVGSIKK